jgi:hypothetical protein
MAFSLSSCHYLDIVPDNIATIDYAFRTEHTAEQYLFTCYSYLPAQASLTQNPAWMSGDEFWIYYPLAATFTSTGREIARGNQNIVDPYLNFWDGTQNGAPLYKGIRDCNTFLDNIGNVPDLEDYQARRWIAEVRFLKAWYQFWLMRMYGPIVLIKDNLPVSSSPEDVKLYRAPMDSCVDYIIGLINEAIPDLPDEISDRQTELGRITKAIALSEKAKILVTMASPLFNGNSDYKNLVDNKGVHLFDATPSAAKWDSAVAACREAIDACQASGISLYHYVPGAGDKIASPETITKMSIRNSLTEKWNTEVIWGDPNGMAGAIQNEATPPGLDPSNPANTGTRSNLSVPIKIAEMFYTRNGVPISEDKTYNYAGRYSLREAADSERFNIDKGYTTAILNFDREPRFYADLGFDGGIWYGQGKYDDQDTWHLEAKSGQSSTHITNNRQNITGYWPKKVVNYQNIIGTGNTYTIKSYPWPNMRLADLYLLYAEALNEAGGPSDLVYAMLDSVRLRAGVPPVKEAWAKYARDPDAYTTQAGLRKIIHTERMIELAFEGQRFWDLRRWKEAITELNNPVTGWHTDQATAEGYYQPLLLYSQTFQTKDYLWPLKEQDLIVDKNLVQNPGW